MRYVLMCFMIIFLSGCAQLTHKESEKENSIIEDPHNESEPSLEKIEEKQPPIAKEVEKFETLYKVNEISSVVPIKEGVNEQVVLLTIDDAPDQYGDEMAETLAQLEVGAIFFVNGHFLQNDEGKEKLMKIHELGFEIGNHTMNHPYLNELSREKQRQEIVELNDLVEEVIGERPRFFRAPYGVNTEISEKVVQEEGMQSMNWSYGYDFEQQYMEKDKLADIMVNTPLLVNGANLLMHDREFTKDALEKIVSGLKEKGYEIVHPKQIQ